MQAQRRDRDRAWRPGWRAARLAALTAGLAAGLAGCGAPISREYRYTGRVSPVGHCGPASDGTLSVSRDHFVFTPDDGVLMISGTIGADGTVKGELATVGADKKPFVMALAATATPEHVDGSYVTPRCHFTVALTRVHPGLF